VCFVYSYTYIIVSNPQPIIIIIIIKIIMEAQNFCTTNQSHNYSPTFAIILGLPARYLGPQVDEPKYEFFVKRYLVSTSLQMLGARSRDELFDLGLDLFNLLTY
jgi:hypothetical protein